MFSISLNNCTNIDVLESTYSHNLLMSYLRWKGHLQSFLFLARWLQTVRDYSQISWYFQCILMLILRIRFGFWDFWILDKNTGPSIWKYEVELGHKTYVENIVPLFSVSITKKLHWMRTKTFKVGITAAEIWNTPSGFKGFIKSSPHFELWENIQYQIREERVITLWKQMSSCLHFYNPIYASLHPSTSLSHKSQDPKRFWWIDELRSFYNIHSNTLCILEVSSSTHHPLYSTDSRISFHYQDIRSLCPNNQTNYFSFESCRPRLTQFGMCRFISSWDQ